MKKAVSAATLAANANEILQGGYTMNETEMQEQLEIEEVEPVDFQMDSPYYYDRNPDNVDFIGWRDLVW